MSDVLTVEIALALRQVGGTFTVAHDTPKQIRQTIWSLITRLRGEGYTILMERVTDEAGVGVSVYRTTAFDPDYVKPVRPFKPRAKRKPKPDAPVPAKASKQSAVKAPVHPPLGETMTVTGLALVDGKIRVMLQPSTMAHGPRTDQKPWFLDVVE